MKKIISIISIILILSSMMRVANATIIGGICDPTWSGTWTVTGNCTFSQTAKVFGNIIVGPYTVTVPNGVTLGIDLSVNKITFTTGKMLFQGSAKANNSTTVHYVTSISYSAGAPTSPCTAGMKVVKTDLTALIPDNPTTYPTPTGASYYEAVAPTGTMYCAWP